MNLEKVFNFIKEKRGYEIPLKYKLINGLPLSEDELIVNDDLDLHRTNITSLPDNLNVGGDLDLGGTNITSLPDNLKVGGSLFLYNTNITSLPDNLKVGCHLYIRHIPLSKKYSKEDIKKMIEDKGGYVRWSIFI